MLVQGDLQRTVLTSDLGRVLGLEGCLSGNVPTRARAAREAAARRARARRGTKPAKVVYGPGTFVNTAVNQIATSSSSSSAHRQRQAERGRSGARRSRRRGYPPAEQERLAPGRRAGRQQKFTAELVQLGAALRAHGHAAIDDTTFVSQLVFDPARGVGQPKPRFAYLFPSSDAALIHDPAKPDLSDAAARAARST